jgi:hypothetical protein
MIINVTLFDRIQLGLCIPRNCALDEMAQFLRISDALELTDEEKGTCSYQIVRLTTPQGLVSYPVWDDEAEGFCTDDVEIEIDKADLEKLCKLARARDSWPRKYESMLLHDKLDQWQKEAR